jgi:hypothetical protein
MEARYQVIESLLLRPDASRLLGGGPDGEMVMATAVRMATIGAKSANDPLFQEYFRFQQKLMPISAPIGFCEFC